MSCDEDISITTSINNGYSNRDVVGEKGSVYSLQTWALPGAASWARWRSPTETNNAS
jgi:hypothetical protein